MGGFRFSHFGTFYFLTHPASKRLGWKALGAWESRSSRVKSPKIRVVLRVDAEAVVAYAEHPGSVLSFGAHVHGEGSVVVTIFDRVPDEVHRPLVRPNWVTPNQAAIEQKRVELSAV